MASREKPDVPAGTPDEVELLLRWLGYLRGAVLRKVEGVSDSDARWTPDGRLICLLGIINHLTHVEWRWIDGSMRGEEVSRSEEEFAPAPSSRWTQLWLHIASEPRTPTPRSGPCR